METVILKLKDIKPAKYNPRIELKQDDEEYEALKNSLDKFGEAKPLVINRTTGNLLSGHQRLNALKEMGVEETEVILIDIDEEKEKLANIALNKLEGDWDYEKLEILFSEFSKEDIKFTGYTTDEIEGLFGSDTTEPKFGDEDSSDEETESTPKEKPEKPEKEFSIFFSFPSKEAAENWLKEKGQEHKFEGTSHNITIRMEGADFGTRN